LDFGFWSRWERDLPTPTVVVTCDVDDLSSLLANTTVQVQAI